MSIAEMVSYLRKRFEEEAAAAHAAAKAVGLARWSAIGGQGEDRASISCWHVVRVAAPERFNIDNRAVMKFIAHGDPASVLADIRARRLAVAHVFLTASMVDALQGCRCLPPVIASGQCPTFPTIDDLPLLRALTQRYETRPDFPPEWQTATVGVPKPRLPEGEVDPTTGWSSAPPDTP